MVAIIISLFDFISEYFKRFIVKHIHTISINKQIRQHLFTPPVYQLLAIQVQSVYIRFSKLIVTFYFTIQFIGEMIRAIMFQRTVMQFLVFFKFIAMKQSTSVSSIANSLFYLCTIIFRGVARQQQILVFPYQFGM